MKKTFKINGCGNVQYTTDKVRETIERSKKSIADYEWDLENWDDIPKHVTRQKILVEKMQLERWEKILEIAIQKGWDNEI